MATVILENTKEATIHLSVVDEEGYVKQLKVPGARRNKETNILEHGKAKADASFVEYARKTNKVAKSFFDKGTLLVHFYNMDSVESEVKDVNFDQSKTVQPQVEVKLETETADELLKESRRLQRKANQGD
jgi:hypothetical protein